jgi:hypothetical protein
LPQLLEPLIKGEADAVFGSRMMESGKALKGGMPLYKYLGNKVLTIFENAALGMNLTEFHSGYRLYSCHALAQLPFDKNTRDFHFDTQIIIQLQAAGMRIVELPIPTYYGDEICYVNGMKYAKDVFRSVVEFRAHELGFMHRSEYELKPRYTLKSSPLSSHSQLLGLVGPPSRRVLDLEKCRATLRTLKAHPGRVIAFFQPHGYGPLRQMGAELAQTFAEELGPADIAIFCKPVYYGGTTDMSVGSEQIVALINKAGGRAEYIPERDDCADRIVELARSGDRIVVMGARDDTLTQFAKDLLARVA